MKHKHYYYKLDKPRSTYREIALSVLKFPFSLPSWIVSFFLARTAANIILSPDNNKQQLPVQIIKLSDDDTHEEVLINLIPQEPNKRFRDYVRKFQSTFFRIPYLGITNNPLSFSDPGTKEYIDNQIHEIGLLLNGTSNAKKCEGKKFSWDSIHLKGLEHLDPAVREYLFTKLENTYGPAVETPPKTNLEFFSLETADEAVLDSVAVSAASEKDKPISERKFVIACLANSQSYIKWLRDFKYSAEQIGCTVIGFNYRGIDYNKGKIWTESNMIDDIMSQVLILIENGAKPENIGLEGMCVGGAAATIAASKLHEQGIKVKLYNERSYRSTARFLVGWIFPDGPISFWNPLTWVRYAVMAVLYLTLVPLIWLASWPMDAGRAWDSIPESYKEYSIVRNTCDPNPCAPQYDGIVGDSWSSIASLVDEHRANIAEKVHTGQPLTQDEAALLADNRESHYFKADPAFKLENKTPHVISRRHLVQTQSVEPKTEPQHLHQHMIRSFRNKLFTPKTANSETTPRRIDHALSI